MLVTLSLFALLAQAVPAPTLPYRLYKLPFYETQSDPPQPLSERLENLRLGCIATKGGDVKRKDCLDLADSIAFRVRLVQQELVYLQLTYNRLSDEERLSTQEVLEKNRARVRQLWKKLDERYPYVRFYISPALRLAA